MSTESKREAILAAARLSAQSRGFNGLNFRDLAERVGMSAPSIYHHFATKADLGTAVARRYWEDTKAHLDALAEGEPDPLARIRKYPLIFRRSLESENRLCLGSFMSAEFDDLPDAVKKEVQAFADVNVAWLSKTLVAAGVVGSRKSEARARAIFAAIAGAQLLARSRSDVVVFDTLIDNYRGAGLLP